MKFAPSCQSNTFRQSWAFISAIVLFCLCWAAAASAQNTIQTIGGGGKVSGSATGVMADIAGPSSVTKDPQGNTYVAAPAQNQVFKIDTSGNISIFAGVGYPSEDPQKLNGGLATAGTLNSPIGLASDKFGNIFIADTTDYLIRKVAKSSGKISDVAGNAHQCQDPTQVPYACGDNGINYNATLGAPTAVATDKAGNVYIADTNDNRVRVVNLQSTTITIAGVSIPSGYINSIAGTGFNCSSSTSPCGDGGPALSADLNGPNGIALDSAGNIYVADTGDRRIRMITTTGTISTYAGTGNPCQPAKGCGDGGTAISANISAPWQISFDASGNLYITDPPEAKIREVLANGTIQTFAGNGTRGFAGDGSSATGAEINSPRGVFADSSGNVLIGDTGNQRVRLVSAGGTPTITTFAGGGNGGDGGSATSAILAGDRATAVDGSGNVYVADTANNRIRKISGGIITTFAGTGIATYTGDNGPATAATLSNPDGVAVDGSGNVYIADSSNLVIRMVNTSGTITTVAGNGKSCAPSCGDGGPATSASFVYPTTVSVDASGNFYIADQRANQVRMVNAGGTISTVAGTGAACTNTAIGACGDGGSATQSQLNGPFSAVADPNGNVYIADTNDNRVRVVSGGIINAYAFNGDGVLFGPNKGNALQFAFNTPQDLAMDPGGNIYVAGSGLFYVIPRIDFNAPGNITAIVSGKAGDPKYYGYTGDGGLALGAELDNFGASIDASGHLYVADGVNNRVREISVTPSATIAPSSLVFSPEPIGTTSPAMSFKLTNNGSDDLKLSSVTVSGDFALATQPPCNANQVAPSLPCSIGVTFTPTTYGTRTGKVVISDNAYQDPTQTVYLTGYGPDFTISANPNSLTVTHGNQGTSTLTLTPSGGFNQTVQLTCTGAPKKSTCSISPNSITLDGTNAATATLTISTGAGTLPGSYTLLATGTSVTKHSATIALTVQ